MPDEINVRDVILSDPKPCGSKHSVEGIQPSNGTKAIGYKNQDMPMTNINQKLYRLILNQY